jgi:hypothetical protein
MHDLINTGDMLGTLEISYIYQDGHIMPLFKTKNLILYSGADILARVLTGDTDYKVNGMFLEYRNGIPAAPSITRSRVRTYYEGLVAPSGYVRVPTLAAASFAASSTDYSGNMVTYIATTDGTYVNGPGIADGVSQFYAAALVAMPDFADRTQYIVFSASNFLNSTLAFTPITKVANAQISVKWTIKFI